MKVLLLNLRAIRAQFLTAVIVPIMAGGALGWYETGRFSWALWLTALVAGCFLHAAANVLNDYTDEVLGCDRANPNPTPFSGGSRLLQSGELQLADAKALIWLYLFGAIVLTAWLALAVGWQMAALAGAGIVVLFAYNSPGVFAMGKGWGEALTGIGFGPLPVLWGYMSVTGSFGPSPLLLGSVIAFFIMAVLYVNEIPDMPGDLAAGKRTHVTRVGLRIATRNLRLLFTAGFMLLLVFAVFDVLPMAVLLGFAGLPIAAAATTYSKLWLVNDPLALKSNALTIVVHLVVGFGLTAGLVLAKVLA